MEAINESLVANFYKDKSIFLTGATGFVGKVLVEKLLRSCPEIKAVYCLMRPKRNEDAATRFSKFAQNQVFDRLREENPKNLLKIQLVSGDIAADNLGLTEKDRSILINEVNVVFHSAATVKFTEPLPQTLQMNTFGTKRIVQLCKEIKNIDAFVYVSTFYSNSNFKEIREVVYTPRVDHNELEKICANLSEHGVDEKAIIGDHPNAYTFTKSLAEFVVESEVGSIPTAIVRPPIIASSLQEPFPGWIDNLTGFTGLTVNILRGTLRSSISDVNCKLEVVPVDVVVNTLIVAAASLKKNYSTSVYNCVIRNTLPFTWGYALQCILDASRKYPTKYAMFYPHCTFRQNVTMHLIMNFIAHFLPAFLVDTARGFSGKKPIALRLYQRTKSAAEGGRYFATNEWAYEDNNFKSLADSLNECDKKRFMIQCQDLNWGEYFNTFVKGIHRYLLKDESFATSSTKKMHNNLYWTMILLRGCAIIFIGYFLIEGFLSLASIGQ